MSDCFLSRCVVTNLWVLRVGGQPGKTSPTHPPGAGVSSGRTTVLFVFSALVHSQLSIAERGSGSDLDV